MSNPNENMPARRVEDNRQAGPLAWDGAAPAAEQRTAAPITVDQLEHLNPSRTGLGVMERREGGAYVRVADVRRMDATRAAAGVPAHEQDLLDIVRTLCSTAQRLAELSPAQRANYPSPLSPMSPLFQAASAACVERGYTRWGLAIEGAAYPAPAAQPAPVAAAGVLAEALAVFDLMLRGCSLQDFGDYQNGDGEEIGPRMDALHAKLRAACAGAPAPVAAQLAKHRIAELGYKLRMQAFENAQFRTDQGSKMTVPEQDEFNQQIEFARAIEREVLASLAPVAAEPAPQVPTAAEVRAAALEKEVAQLKQLLEKKHGALFLANQALHNTLVGNQSAWIEWRHGAGAEEAMTWIHNGLAGPGLIPYGKEAQPWFDANQDDRYDIPPMKKLTTAAAPSVEVKGEQGEMGGAAK